MELRSAQASSGRARFRPVGAATDPTGSSSPLSRAFETMGRKRQYTPGSTIMLHGDPADTLFQVVSGTVRCCTIMDDGRRCIFRFARPGDFLGFPEFETWHFTVEAVDHARLIAVRRLDVEHVLRETTAPLQHEINNLIAKEFAARENQLVMLSHARAEERLVWFLREFGGRLARGGFIVLPMTRQDIGDHLGMTLETVSRVFGALKRRGLIEMCGSNKVRFMIEGCSRAA